MGGAVHLAARLPGRPIAPPPVGYVPIAADDSGALITVEAIAQVIREHHPAVRELAENILAAHRFPRSNYERAAVLYEWVRSRVVYPAVQDHADVEELRWPEYLLRRIAQTGRLMGDCDDLTVLIGSLARSVGLPVRLVVVSTYASGRPRELSHVFPEIQTERGWTTADAIIGKPFGWETRDQSRRVEVTV